MWRPICASTEIELSNWIAEKPVKQDQPKAIFASCQKYGQGQFGRNWYSPKGGVWVSAAIKIEGQFQNTSELYGLAVALALVERIELIGGNVKIKWPNDLFINGKKLAGILPRVFFRGGWWQRAMVVLKGGSQRNSHALACQILACRRHRRRRRR